MMLSTHLMAGGVLGLALSLFYGDLHQLVLIGMLASLIPDLDLFFNHRKTFHRPFQYTFVSIILSLFFLSTGNIHALTFSLVTGSMALHSIMEIFSEDRRLSSEGKKSVFNHLKGEWVSALDWIKVGSIRDLSLSVILSAPLFYTGNLMLKIIVSFVMVYGIVHYNFKNRTRKELIALNRKFH